MAVPKINPALRWIVLSGVLVVSALLAFLGCRHAIAEYRADSTDPNQLADAAQLEPANAENWYRLGRYRQLDFENSDLAKAISYYERATAIDPWPARYWLDLADAYEATGNIAASETAFRQAQQNYPISADVAWRLGNFLLRQGRAEEAFREIHQAVSADPKLTSDALSLCWRSTKDVDLILREALPANQKVDWAAIQFFINLQEADAAVVVWKRLMTEDATFPISQVFPLMDMLLTTKHADDAETIWRQALTSAGVSKPPAASQSAIWDGGFEGPLLNGGLAWRYRPTSGAEMDIDEEIVHTGHRALRVVFDGSLNLDFSSLWQYVTVQPNTRYGFTAYLRTQDLTTDSGIRFEIADANQIANLNVFTPGATGTQPWTLDQVGFTTGSSTRVLVVALRRTQSSMLTGKIRGTAWVDDVSLVAAGALGSGAK